MSRREFTKTVKVEIIRRATWGYRTVDNVHCENCGLTTKQFEIDHRDPDAMQIDKTSRTLTARDGWLLCKPCHAKKTKGDVADIARAKRREARHLGAKSKSKWPIASKGFAGRQRAHADRPALPPKLMFKGDK